MTTPTRDQVLRAPKVLLHDHLDGGLRPQTIVDLAAGEQQHHTAHLGRLRAEHPPQPGRAHRRRLLCHDRTFSEAAVYTTRPGGHLWVSTDARTPRDR